MKVDVYNIIEYEINKVNFYKNRDETIEAIITDAYCIYEEIKYGDKLTEIYMGLSKIREGKEYLKKQLKHMFLILFAITLFTLTKNFIYKSIYNIANMLCIVALMLEILLSVAKVKKYWLFLKYVYLKKRI